MSFMCIKYSKDIEDSESARIMKVSPWSFGSAHAARNEINSLKNLRTEYASLAKGTLTPTHFPIFLSSYIRETVLVKNYKLFHTFEYDIDVDFTLTGNSFLF